MVEQLSAVRVCVVQKLFIFKAFYFVIAFYLFIIFAAFLRARRSSSEYFGLPLVYGTLHSVPLGNLFL